MMSKIDTPMKALRHAHDTPGPTLKLLTDAANSTEAVIPQYPRTAELGLKVQALLRSVLTLDTMSHLRASSVRHALYELVPDAEISHFNLTVFLAIRHLLQSEVDWDRMPFTRNQAQTVYNWINMK